MNEVSVSPRRAGGHAARRGQSVGIVALATALSLGAAPLLAQIASADADAPATAATITAATVARYAEVLARDSLRGRGTPSPALTRAAQYVAAQFQQLGLTPGVRTADTSTWLESYPLPGRLRLDEAASSLSFSLQRDSSNLAGRAKVTVSLAAAAYLAVPLISPAPAAFDGRGRGTLLVTGRHTAASLQQLELHSRTVLYMPPAGLESAERQWVIDQLYARSRGVVVLEVADSITFAAAHAAARAHPPLLVDLYLQNALRPHGWVVYVWPGAITDVLNETGIDLARARTDRAPAARALPLEVRLVPRPQGSSPESSSASAPNVVGQLEGRDSLLRREYVVFLAHLDDGGGRPLRPDPLDPELGGALGPGGNHDNRAGVAGLLALAEAFSRSEARPRRSLYFVATSGGAKPEFWGAAFAALQREGQIVSVINLDVIGQAGRDSVLIAGLREADSVTAADWTAAAHPELGLTVVDGGTAFAPESDHYAFSRLSVPLLYFHTGTQGDIAESTSPAAVDADQTARVVRLVFYVGRDVANANARPRLNAAGRRHYLIGIDRWE